MCAVASAQSPLRSPQYSSLRILHRCGRLLVGRAPCQRGAWGRSPIAQWRSAEPAGQPAAPVMRIRRWCGTAYLLAVPHSAERGDGLRCRAVAVRTEPACPSARSTRHEDPPLVWHGLLVGRVRARNAERGDGLRCRAVAVRTEPACGSARSTRHEDPPLVWHGLLVGRAKQRATRSVGTVSDVAQWRSAQSPLAGQPAAPVMRIRRWCGTAYLLAVRSGTHTRPHAGRGRVSDVAQWRSAQSPLAGQPAASSVHTSGTANGVSRATRSAAPVNLPALPEEMYDSPFFSGHFSLAGRIERRMTAFFVASARSMPMRMGCRHRGHEHPRRSWWQ